MYLMCCTDSGTPPWPRPASHQVSDCSSEKKIISTDFTINFFQNSSLVFRVKLPLPFQIICLDRHWTKVDVDHGVTDRHHGQLSLHGVDHVGHGVGEILESGSVHLVRHNTNTEYLQITLTIILIDWCLLKPSVLKKIWRWNLIWVSSLCHDDLRMSPTTNTGNTWDSWGNVNNQA